MVRKECEAVQGTRGTRPSDLRVAKPLDIEQPAALVDYLRSTGRIGLDERPRCSRLSGGVSNRTVLVERASGEAWVLKQALEKLRVAVEWFSDPERVHREALGMRWLSQLAPPGSVPEFLFEDHEHHLVAMKAIPQPHGNWKSLLLAGELERDHVEQYARLLAAIHRNGYGRRDQLSAAFEDRSIFESLRVEPYYRYTASQVPAAAEFLYGLVEEMYARRITLVHGDYSPKNVLVTPERLVLVDHEVIHFGDPAVDIGFSLAHLLSKANHLAHRRADFAAAAALYWGTYRGALGELPWAGELERHAVRHTLACLLARVAGRSRLEYLDQSARGRQARAACKILGDPPERVEELVHSFTRWL
jgi:5-methylthioribose kinase